MITTTQTYKDKILSDERQLRMKIIFNGRQEIDGHSLKNVTIHEVSNGKDILTIGSICSNSIQLTMSYLEDIQYMNSSIEVFIGLMIDNDIEWIPMGTYIISEISQDNQYEVTLEGYDLISNLNIGYQPQIEYPATLKDVIHDIANQCHITLKPDVFEDIIIDKPLDVTCKEMLSYMSSLLGRNVRMNRYNQLEFFWYEAIDYVIEDKDQYQGGFKKNNSLLTISSLTSGDEENIFTCGSGYGITFDNPYMTQERLEKIFEKINGLTYLPCTCTWRGDPSIEVSDLIRIDNHNIVIMDNIISFDGGMKSSIESLGQNEKEVVMSKSPTEILLKKFYRTLLNSYKDISENILGHKGGYYTVDMDENGHPNGWTIMNTPILRDDTHLWRMSMGGFGYSEDGGKTFRNFAFDLNGNFSANAINTGQLSGDMFELDLEHGTVKFGMRDNEGHITEPFLSMDQEGLKIKHITQIENDVSKLMKNFNVYLETNCSASQIYDSNALTYTPDFFTNNLVITANVYDLEGNELSEAKYEWKRKTKNGLGPLVAGEHVNNNILTISHNFDESVTFVCTATLDLISKKEELIVVSTKTGKNGKDGSIGPQGVPGPQGVQGPKGVDGKQYYTWLKYADTPTTGMSDNPTGKAYIGLAYNKEASTESNNYSDYTWSLIKGEKGEQGVTGGKGADGTTFYTWIKYATSSSGANISDDPTGKNYIGLAYNKTTPTESTNAADYTWSLIKGDKGDKGDAGKGIESTAITYQAGTSGTTAPTGTWATSIPTVAQGQYLWSKTVITYTDNTTSTTYSVAYIPKNGTNGTNGATGATGTGVNTIVQQYYLSTSKTTQSGGSWVTAMPTWSTGLYLWTRYAITYKNPTSTAYTSPICDSSWEAANEVKNELDQTIEDTSQSLSELIANARSELESEITKRANAIIMEVSQSYYSKNGTDELIASISSTLTQTEKDFLMKFDSITQVINDNAKSTDNEFKKISKYIKFNEEGIILGEDGTQLTLSIQNDRIVFKQSDKELAYFTNSRLFIVDGEFTQSLRIGQFAFVPRSNGSLDFKKVG